jgi:hypothetical protein
MFDHKTDLVIDLVERINGIISEMNDAQDIEAFQGAIELARDLRDELETIADD